MLFVIGGQQEISSAGVIQVRLPFAGLGAAERHSPAQHAPARHDAACVCVCTFVYATCLCRYLDSVKTMH
jgi:hypothetical protein